MGAVASVAKKIAHGVESGVSSVVHEVGEVGGDVTHAIVHGAGDVLHVVHDIPGIGTVVGAVEKGVKGAIGLVAKAAPIVGKVASVVGKFAPMLGPEGMEAAKMANTVSGYAGEAGKIASGLHSAISSDGEVCKMVRVYDFTNGDDVKRLCKTIMEEQKEGPLMVTLVGKRSVDAPDEILRTIQVLPSNKQAAVGSQGMLRLLRDTDLQPPRQRTRVEDFMRSFGER